MTYYRATITAETMGDATADDARDYAAWLEARLGRDYPEADVRVRASEGEARVETDAAEDEIDLGALFGEWLTIQASRPLAAREMLIMSGEGTGEGTIERYYGARKPAAIRSRLSRERTGGERWAEVWISTDQTDDAGMTAYQRLGRDLEPDGTMRAIPASAIRDNPAAQLAAGHKRPWAAASGAKGGRPRKIN